MEVGKKKKDGSGIYLLGSKFISDRLHLAYIQLISRNGAQMLQNSHATIMFFFLLCLKFARKTLREITNRVTLGQL